MKRVKKMRYTCVFLVYLFLVAVANGKQISNDECEEIWAKGEIIHDFDELEISGGNYRPRSFIRYKGSMYYAILAIESSKGKEPNVWLSMNCWDSDRQK